jgi:very-short-patch-repair endonuclease
MWPAVDRAARAQHGLIAREQLQAQGFTDSMVRTARRTGRLIDVQPGVFRILGVPQTHDQMLLAAAMCVGPPAAVGFRGAAQLWGLRCDQQRVEIVVPHAVTRKPRHVTVHRSSDFDPNHFTRRRGIPVTKPARTLADLAAVLATDELDEVVDRALVSGLVTEGGLRTMIDELTRQGRRGPAALRRTLDGHPLAGVRPESVIEPVMAAILKHSAVGHRFVYQHQVCIEGRKYRMDFAAPSVKVGIEVLGLREHGTRRAVIDDSDRRRILRLHGWEILEYTKQAMTRSPVRVAREICAFVEDLERQFPGWSTRI